MTASYLICATPRSGSTLLCELLALTGVAGHPNEWMLPLTAPLAQEMFGIATAFEDPRYLVELKSKATTSNRVFAAKLMWPTMEQFLDGALWGLAGGGTRFRLDSIFSDLRYVHISRDDKLRQAISLLLALRTDYWQQMATTPALPTPTWPSVALRLDAHSERPRIRTEDAVSRWPAEEIASELEDPARRAELMAEIDTYYGMIRQHETAWAGYFRRQGVVPFTVRYEDLVADPATVTCDLLRFLGLPKTHAPNLDAIRLRPLSDARNVLLVSAYKADRSGARDYLFD